MYNKKHLTLEEQASLTVSHLVDVVQGYDGLFAVELTNPAVIPLIQDCISDILGCPTVLVGKQLWVLQVPKLSEVTVYIDYL